jgi:hypothetical protein
LFFGAHRLTFDLGLFIDSKTTISLCLPSMRHSFCPLQCSPDAAP